MYADYPMSREMLHWESLSNTSESSVTGQNLINHEQRGYTVLFFARATEREDGRAVPFTYLGPATRLSHRSERPIQMVWKLRHLMPAELFEENRRGG
jgi:hypothetical protein